MDINKALSDDFQRHEVMEKTLGEYLEMCSTSPKTYASPAANILKSFGEPEIVDTSDVPRLSRIHGNRIIRRYPAFLDFYGLEDVIENIAGYFRRSAQGLEESRQVLYLLGPVGGGKSSIADAIVNLVEKTPIWRIKGSPVNDHPFALFDINRFGKQFEEEYGIPRRMLKVIPSPWLVKRIEEANGDFSNFVVERVYPSKLGQLAISRTEPGDKHNQDVSTLIGKTSIRKLEKFDQEDPDSYGFSGALNIANQGIMEFVEMFKADITMLNPLLTATQENQYTGTETIGAIPFNGTIIAHSNEAEWSKFKNDKTNEAFIDRICIVKVPYCLRYTEESEIYDKLLRNSELSDAPIAPGTLDILARFAIQSRLVVPENSLLYSKMRVYNGDNIKETDNKAKSIQEYQDAAGVNEGMKGLSTRFAYKVLAKVFNFDMNEISANPVHLFYVLEKEIMEMESEHEEAYKALLKELMDKYWDFINKEIQTAYMESYTEYGQNLFDTYVNYADYWIQDQDYRDPNTGDILDRAILNEELEKTEKAAGISNPKDFRNEIVHFILRARANLPDGIKVVDWRSYTKLKEVIEAKMFSSMEDMMPSIQFGVKADKETDKKHDDFVGRMKERGYTQLHVHLLTEWHRRIKASR